MDWLALTLFYLLILPAPIVAAYLLWRVFQDLRKPTRPTRKEPR